MGTSSANVTNNTQTHATQHATDPILPEGTDAQNLQQFFDALLKNAKPGERDALEALLQDLKGYADASVADNKGFFGKIFDHFKDNINQNLVPFLETLANNPGAFGKDVPPGMNLDDTMDYIVANAPAHLQPLMQDLAKDIQGFAKTNSEQGHAIANLMGYLVNKGNDIAEAKANGSAMDAAGGNSPNGVGPDNMVKPGENKATQTADTITKTADALKLIAEMKADPHKITPENIQKLAALGADIVSDIAASGGDTKAAEMIMEQISTLSMDGAKGAGDIQKSLSALLDSLIAQLIRDDGSENRPDGGGKKGKGASGAGGGAGGADGAGAADGGGAADGAGGTDGAGSADGGSAATSDPGGLSIFDILAKALGDKMTSKLKEMKAFAEQISSLSESGGDSTEVAGLSAQLSAASQEFSLLSQSFSTTIKALGEGTKAAVRYS